MPSDRNRRLRWGCYLGGSGSGEVVEALGWLEGIRQDTREAGWGDRRAPIRAAHGHIIYILGVAAGAGEGMDGGAMGRHEGGLSRFGAPKAKM